MVQASSGRGHGRGHGRGSMVGDMVRYGAKVRYGPWYRGM